MATEVASAYVTLLPSAKGFGKGISGQIGGDLDKAGREGGRRFGGGMSAGLAGLGTKLFAPLAAAGAAIAVGDFFKGAISEARESQKVGALTTQVIKSTGGAAKVTAGQVGDLATAISNKTGIDDEAIQSASNLLLTFTNVRNEVGKGNDVFNQATQAATDMGAALGTEPKAAAIQLGKALNDPIKGVTALQRVGVSFTESQKKQIKTLVGSGKTLEAQKLILGELRKEFGGAAAASATAGEKFSTTFGNFKEAIGTALLPILDKVLGASTKFVGTLTTKIGPAFQQIGAFLRPVSEAVNVFFTALGNGEVTTVGPLGKIGAAAYAIRDAFVAAMPKVQALLSTVVGVVMTQVVPAVKALVGYIVANVVPILLTLGGIIVTKIVPAFLAVARFVYGTVYPAILAIAVAVAARLKPVLDALFAVIKGRIIPVIQLVAAKFQEWWPTIQKVVLFVVSVLGWVLKLAAAILGKVLPVVIRFAGFLLTVVVKALIGVIEFVAKAIGWIIKLGAGVVNVVRKFIEFERGVFGVVGRVVKFFVDLPGRIIGALGNVDDLLLGAGRKIIDGLLRGITEGFKKVKDKLGELTGKLPDWKGPATKDKVILRDAGRLVIGGFIGGMESQYDSVRASLRDLTTQVGRPQIGATVGVAGAGAGTGPATFHLYDSDGVLLGTMRGAAVREASTQARRIASGRR